MKKEGKKTKMKKITNHIYLDEENGAIAIDATTQEEAREITLRFLHDNGIPNLYGISIGDEMALARLDIPRDMEDTLLNHDEEGERMSEYTAPLMRQTISRLINMGLIREDTSRRNNDDDYLW